MPTAVFDFTASVRHEAQNGAWLLQVRLIPDSCGLSRVLQNLNVPSVQLTGMRFQKQGEETEVEIDFSSTAAWAQLTSRRIEKLPAVRYCRLTSGKVSL